MDGVRNRLEPPVGTTKNVFHMTEEDRKEDGIECLPENLFEAHQRLLEDELICTALGSHVVDALSNVARIEWDAFRTAVHPWELERYLPTY